MNRLEEIRREDEEDAPYRNKRLGDWKEKTPVNPVNFPYLIALVPPERIKEFMEKLLDQKQRGENK